MSALSGGLCACLISVAPKVIVSQADPCMSGDEAGCFDQVICYSMLTILVIAWVSLSLKITVSLRVGAMLQFFTADESISK